MTVLRPLFEYAVLRLEFPIGLDYFNARYYSAAQGAGAYSDEENRHSDISAIKIAARNWLSLPEWNSHVNIISFLLVTVILARSK